MSSYAYFPQIYHILTWVSHCGIGSFRVTTVLSVWCEVQGSIHHLKSIANLIFSMQALFYLFFIIWFNFFFFDTGSYVLHASLSM